MLRDLSNSSRGCPLDVSVEPVDLVRGVGDCAHGTVGLGQAVATGQHSVLQGLLLALDVTGSSVVHSVRELVRRVGVDGLSVSGDSHRGVRDRYVSRGDIFEGGYWSGRSVRDGWGVGDHWSRGNVPQRSWSSNVLDGGGLVRDGWSHRLSDVLEGCSRGGVSHCRGGGGVRDRRGVSGVSHRRASGVGVGEVRWLGVSQGCRVGVGERSGVSGVGDGGMSNSRGRQFDDAALGGCGDGQQQTKL